MTNLVRDTISGKAVSVIGSNIDTDRIIPARYLKCVTFEGLTDHAFEDDRAQMKESSQIHPFDQAEFSDAQILITGENFGCGSSREHAPQALIRWNKGIRAIIGISFAEIFFGNCITLGIPCVTTDKNSLQKIMNANQKDPNLEFRVDLLTMKVTYGNSSIDIDMPNGPREQLIKGRWDPTVELLENVDAIDETAAKLPYFRAWK